MKRVRAYRDAAADDPAQDRQLPGRPLRQQVHVLPRAHAHRRDARRRRSASRITWTATATSSATSRRGAISASSATCAQDDVKPLVEEHVPGLRDARQSPQEGSDRRNDRHAATMRSCGATGASLRRPSAYFSLGFLTVGGFIAGIVFWGGFNTALKLTNTERSASAATRCATTCTSGAAADHPLHQPLAACAPSVPTATCRTTGPTRSRARCRRRRKCGARSSARSARARSSTTSGSSSRSTNGRGFKANDSLECRNCHGFDSMDFTRQSPRAAEAHSHAPRRTGEKTCIDCHKGIAHRLPDMAGQ